MYRYKRSIPLSYERQGQLYFWMLQYRDLPPHEQQIIREVCAAVGGDEYAPALLEFVTTDHGKADNWIDLAGYAACGGELDGGGAW